MKVIKILLSPLIIVILIIIFGIGIAGAAIYFGTSSGGETNSQGIDLQKGLVGWWKMDGNAKDSTPYGNNGTPNPCPSGHTNNGNGTCTATFYPNASGDSSPTSVDGNILADNNGVTWAALKGSSNGGIYCGTYPSTAGNCGVAMRTIPGSSTLWARLYRAYFLFDTSALPNDSSISSATLSIYGSSKTNDIGDSPDINIYSSSPASNTDLVCEDFDQVGSTPFSSTITYTNWSTTGYNDFAFNADGLAAISKTAVSKFSTRIATYDAGSTTPTNNTVDATDSLGGYCSEQTGTSQDPKLVVTYTPAAAAGTFTTDRKGQTNKAYSFNGTTDSISIGNVGTVKTVSFWMQANTTASKKVINIDGTEQIETDGSSNVVATSFPAATVYVDGSSASANIPDTNWHFVTITDSTGVSASTFNIGAVSTSYFNGKIDDVRIYNRALSSVEITALYQSYNSSVQISDLQKGLVGNWKMDGNAKDATVNVNHGTVTGATLTTDRKGQTNKAYSFNGTSDYIDAGSGASLQLQGGFTTSMWIKANDVTSYKIFFTIGAGGGVPNTGDIRVSGGSIAAYWNGTGGVYWGASSSTIQTGQWYHIVAIYRNLGKISLYLNGISQTDSATGSQVFGGTIWQTLIGKGQYGDVSTPFSGSMDDVRVYNRALSQAEITALYQSYNPGIMVSDLQKGLVGQWKFDGNAKDATVNVNHSTVTGATLTTDRKGQVNKAYSFNGTSDYVTFPNVLNTAGSISMWVKWLRGSVGYGVQGFIANFIYQHSANNCLYTRSWSGAYSYFCPSIPLDTWTHLAFTWTNSSDNSTLLVYANGVPYGPSPGAQGYGSISAITGLANDGSWGSNYLNAVIDDVRAYNRALSQTEITALYQSY